MTAEANRSAAGRDTPVPRRLVVAFWLLILALYFGTRLTALDADPPRDVLFRTLGPELMVEPAAKAHEARNWALFGVWQTNPADNYQFWRAQSPAWVYPLALSYELFGVSYPTLRTTATVLCLPGLFGLVLLAHRRLGATGAVLAGLFAATDQYGIFFGRSGILEPIVAGWAMLGLYFLDRAFDRLAWLAAALAAFVVALATKQAALPVVPVFLWFGAIVVMRSGAGGRDRRTLLILAACALLTAGALTAYAWTPAYARTLAWNFQHMLLARDGGADIDLSAADDVGASGEQFMRRYTRMFQLMPITAVLGVAEVVRQAWLVVRRRSSWRGSLFVVYGIAFAAAVFFVKFFGHRFLMLLGPPLALLSVSFVVGARDFLRDRWAARAARWTPAAVALIFVAYNLTAWAVAWSRLTYQMRDVAAALTAQIGDRADAVVIGLWAAPVILPTRYKHYYVKSTFNSTPAALDDLKVTHTLLMAEGDTTRLVLSEQWPAALEHATPLSTHPLRATTLTLSLISRRAHRQLDLSLGRAPQLIRP